MTSIIPQHLHLQGTIIEGYHTDILPLLDTVYRLSTVHFLSFCYIHSHDHHHHHHNNNNDDDDDKCDGIVLILIYREMESALYIFKKMLKHESGKVILNA